jgi:hypothetical protein
MAVTLHIDRLVLDGWSLAPRERAAMVTALTSHLERLIATSGWTPRAESGFAVPSLPAPSIDLGRPFDPTSCGAAIAESLWQSLRSGGE